MRAELAERARVAHQPQRHPAADAHADLVRVEAADRDGAAHGAEPVPPLHVRLGRVVEHVHRPRDEAERLADAPEPLAGVGHEAPQLDAGQPGGLDVVEGHARAEAAEALRPPGERVRREAEAAGLVHRADDAGGVEALVVDRLVDPEREVVVVA